MYNLTKGTGRVLGTGVDGFVGIAIATAPSRYAAGTGRCCGIVGVRGSSLAFDMSPFSRVGAAEGVDMTSKFAVVREKAGDEEQIGGVGRTFDAKRFSLIPRTGVHRLQCLHLRCKFQSSEWRYEYCP